MDVIQGTLNGAFSVNALSDPITIVTCIDDTSAV